MTSITYRGKNANKSLMFCAISGKPPLVPVISPASKCVFEKSLIEQYVDEHGTDPISKTAVNKGELIEIATSPQQYALSNAVNSPTLTGNYSIPNLLSTLQNEWDAVMLENFELRTQLDTCKKELSTALYRCDAAIRVAAKATKERDELKHTLTKLTEALGGEEHENSNELDATNKIPSTLLTEIVAQSQSQVKATKNVSKMKTKATKALTIDASAIASAISNPRKISVNRLLAPKDRVLCVTLADSAVLIDKDEIKPLSTLPEEMDILYPINSGMVVFANSKEIGSIDVRSQRTKRLMPSTLGKIKSIQYSPDVATGFFFTLNDSKQIHMISLDGSQVFFLANVNDVTPEKELPREIQLHKDGLLLACQVGATRIGIYSINLPEQPPIIIKVNLQNTDDEIVSIRFAPNGYWLYVQSRFEFQVYDLRKDPVVLAMDSIKVEDGNLLAFEYGETGKEVFLLTSDSAVDAYTYVKSKGKWIQGASVRLDSAHKDVFIYSEDSIGKYLQVIQDPSPEKEYDELLLLKIRLETV